MKKKSLLLSVLFLCLFCSNTTYANVIHSKGTGLWHHGSTWQGGVVPSVGDHVIIDGDIVTFSDSSGHVNILKLEINNTNNDPSGLVLGGTKTFEVATDVMVASTTVNDILLRTQDFCTFNILGSLTIDRKPGGSSGEEVQLNVSGHSVMNVGSYFNFNYDEASSSELLYEIKIENDAKMNVLGNMILTSRGGHSFEMNIWHNSELIVNGNLIVEMLNGVNMDIDMYGSGTKLQVNGDMNLVNHGGQGGITFAGASENGKVEVNGNANIESKGINYPVLLNSSGSLAVLEVKKNINLKAICNATVTTKVVNGSTLKLGGTIHRDGNGFGVLKMDETGTLELNGTGPQEIPPSHVLGVDVIDSLYISNLKFNNISGEPITLMGPLYVNDYLDLTGGVLKTTEENMLVLTENASIDPGSTTSYVDGPIQKIGGTQSLPFVFPTGHDGVYAPIEISAINGSTTGFTGSKSVYTAEYRKGDPPPFGELSHGIESITEDQYWKLKNDGGTEQLSITLHWSDPVAAGITNIDSSLVVSYNTTTGSWTNNGREEVSGSNAVDDEGYVVSALGDPPPFGEHLLFTVGNSGAPALPVELMRFEAVREVDEVYLNWATATEMNSSHFIVEHSFDGVNFEPMTTIPTTGGEETMSSYSAKDTKPFYGNNFYRLKIVDKDNSFEYSSIEVVTFDVIPLVSLYPNPVGEYVNLEVGGDADGEGTMEVFDRNGRLIYRGVVSFENGSIQMSASELNANTPGTYVIRIMIEYQEQVIKFIKLK